MWRVVHWAGYACWPVALVHGLGTGTDGGARWVLAVTTFCALAVVAAGLWRLAAVLFAIGWAFQFVGHAFERKPPEFLKDWRFLFVGLRWWVAKLRGRA